MGAKGHADKLAERQANAITYVEWLEASRQLDQLLGYEEWKKVRKSQLYEYELIEMRLNELRSARETHNTTKLLYLIRTTFSRNQGNMGDPKLYMRSFCGTKAVIEDYISECEKAIEYLVNAGAEVDSRLLLNMLVQTRKAFGRTALVLSGGATLGLIHSGVVYELFKKNLLPKIISGTSAGSIFASLLCIHRDDEIDCLWKILDMPIDLFERTGEEESMLTHLRRFLKGGTWIDIRYIRELMQGFVGDLTFQEAYNRTGKILNVTVSTSGAHDVPRLLNYLTAPNVLIWSAVCASCSVPFVFSSVALMAKNPITGEIYAWTKATFIDGSVDNDLPLARLAEMFNVNHFIVCQVNPHIAPLIHLSEKFSDTIPFASYLAKSAADPNADQQEIFANDQITASRLWTVGKALVLSEVAHALDLAGKIGFMHGLISKLTKLMSQEYSGNITIIPRIEFGDLGNLLRNPTPEINKAAMLRGRRATWPKLAIIRNHCAIELALDRAIHTLRTRLIGSSPLEASPLLRQRSRSAFTSDSLINKHRRWQSSTDLNNLALSYRSGIYSNNLTVRVGSSTMLHNLERSKSAQVSPQALKRGFRPPRYNSQSAGGSPTASRQSSAVHLPRLHRHNSNPSNIGA